MRRSRPCVELGLGRGYLTPDEHAICIVVHPRRLAAVVCEALALVGLVAAFLAVLVLAHALGPR